MPRPILPADAAPAQNICFRVDSLLPVFARLNELTYLPEALDWRGEFSFGLTAQSEMRGDGRLHLKYCLSLRCSNTSGDAAESAAGGLRAWLRLLNVRYETLSHPLPMPSENECRFVTKNPLASGGGYERIVLPLPQIAFLHADAVREELLRCPGSGLTLHLIPTVWRNDEKTLVRRFALGGGIPSEQWQSLINDKVFGFVCAAWGINADLIAERIIAPFAPHLTCAAELRRTSGMPLCEDPASLHRLLCGRSRFPLLLAMRELMTLFGCKPLRMGIADQLDNDSSSSLGELKAQIHQQERFIQSLIAKIDSMGTEHARLTELFERQQLLSNAQLQELERALASLSQLSQERDDLKGRLAEYTVHGAEQPLSEKVLRLMGIASEQELLDAGMQEKHLSILRIAAACLKGAPVLDHVQPPVDDHTDYHIYTLYLGFLFEQLLHEHYHNALYLPYYRACMGKDAFVPSVDKTPLGHYDSGPAYTLRGQKISGFRPIDWQSTTMAKRFSECVQIDGKYLPQSYWTAMFVRMYHVRDSRNKLHSSDLDMTKAYSYVHFLLKSTPALPCLIRMILASEHACADFPDFR